MASYVTIGGIEFREAMVEGLLIDPWLAHLELIVAETAWPHGEQKPKRFRIAFDEVIEFRGHRHPVAPEREGYWKGNVSHQAEGVIRAGEGDAPDEVERDEGRYFRLRNPVFRETWKPPGFEPTLPLVAGSRPPRLVWISTWGCYIEFLYCGQASHEILTTSEASVEWQLQHARFRRAREGKGKISAAISKWRRLSERKPTNIEAFVNLGQLHLRIGEHAEARACYEKAAALAPDDLRVLDLEAALATNWDERVAAYRRTLEHYPNLRDASSSLGWFEQLSEEDRSLLPPPAWPSGRDPGPN